MDCCSEPLNDILEFSKISTGQKEKFVGK